MPDISITSSLYRAEKFLPRWQKSLYDFANEAIQLGLKFEVNAIANEPSEAELEILNKLKKESWFNLHLVKRESIYASWNRGVEVAQANVVTSWNVDDIRNAKAIQIGLNKIAEGAELVYFPFTYKRYIKLFNTDILVKKVLVNPPAFSREIFTKEMHCGPFYLFTKSLFKKVGPYDETFRIAGDYDWCVRSAKISNSIVKVGVNSGTFEKRVGTLSGGKNSLQEQENYQVLNKSPQ